MEKRTANDAMLLVLKKYIEKYGQNDHLDNLYNTMQEKLEKKISKNIPGYQFTQDNFIKLIKGEESNPYISFVFKENILDSVYDTIGENGKDTLGNYVDPESKHNTSSWMNHILQVADFASDLAASIGLDQDKARKLGILHDIGRIETHSFEHTIKGYEMLRREGWNEEANVCLTHSHLGGKFVASNEVPPKNLTVDENGSVSWEENPDNDSKMYGIYKFLNSKVNTDYDLVIQLSDLLVEEIGTVNPKKRLEGIRSRREANGVNLDNQANRKVFLMELYNQLKNVMCRADKDSTREIESKFPSIDYTKASVEELNTTLFEGNKSLSKYFSEFYKDKIKGKSKIVEPKQKEEL